MTTTDNFTAQIEPKTNRKKYGKMEFSTPPKKEAVKEVDLKNDEKFQDQLKIAKSYFDDVNLESSSYKLLRKIKFKVDSVTTDLIPILFEINKRPELSEIKKELIPILKRIGDIRKDLSDL
jgi:hypothetical protein